MDETSERMRQLREAGVIFEGEPTLEQFELPSAPAGPADSQQDRARAATERYHEAKQRLHKAQLESEQAFAEMMMEWMKLGKLG